MLTEFVRSDYQHLRDAFDVARRARAHGNHPFGALLVNDNGQVVLEAENTVVTERDCTGHAETNLIRLATRRLSAEVLARCTLYTSTEPCPMCSGAIYWSGVGRVVYGLGAHRLYTITGGDAGKRLPASRDILAVGGVVVLGPLLEDEAVRVHDDFWTRPEHT